MSDETKTVFTVWGGNGHRRLKSFNTHSEAWDYAADFERKCWAADVPVPSSQIIPEEVPA